MNKRKLLRKALSIVSLSMILSMNASQIFTIASAIGESDIISQVPEAAKRIKRLAELSNPNANAAFEGAGPKSGKYKVKIDLLNEEEYKFGSIEYQNITIHKDLKKLQTLMATLGGYGGTGSGASGGDNARPGDTILSVLQDIRHDVEVQQHHYKVAELRSLNNMLPQSAWQPKIEDVPWVEATAYENGRFSNVYTANWNSSISTINNTQGRDDSNSIATTRARQILGYDCDIRVEGIQVSGADMARPNSESEEVDGGTYENVVGGGLPANASPIQHVNYTCIKMNKDAVTWIDAITLLYKALGQEQVTYQAMYGIDSEITPETSPAFQNLSNVVPNGDGSYNGYAYYVFLTRANPIILNDAGETPNPTEEYTDYVYWRKAVAGGFIEPKIAADGRPYTDYYNDKISFKDFYVLATRMMQAYGEPVMNDDELKALLQVYGTHYPIQLGTKVADSWAYLAARGIFDFDPYFEGQTSILYNVPNNANITLDQLLLMCTRIKDKDSRTDFKKINIVLDLSDVMKEDYYFPVYNAKATGDISSTTTIDYSKCQYYDYFVVADNSNDLGTSHPVISRSKDNPSDGSLDAYEEKFNGISYYHFKVPISADYTVYLIPEDRSQVSGAKVNYIEIPATCLGGGVYSQYDKEKGYTIVSERGRQIFDEFTADVDTMLYCDKERAGAHDTVPTETASNAPFPVKVITALKYIMTPTIASAAPTIDASGSKADVAYMSSNLTVPGAKDTNTTSVNVLTHSGAAGSKSGNNYIITLADIAKYATKGSEAGTSDIVAQAPIKDGSLKYILRMSNDDSSAISKAYRLAAIGDANGGSVSSIAKGKTTSQQQLLNGLEFTQPNVHSGISPDEAKRRNSAAAEFAYATTPLWKPSSYSFVNQQGYQLTKADTKTKTLNSSAYKSYITDKLNSMQNDLAAYDNIIQTAKTTSIIGKFNENTGTFSVRAAGGDVSVVGAAIAYGALSQVGNAATTGASSSTSSSDAVTAAQKNGFNVNIYSTAIMNRNKQVLISWTDMKNSGFVSINGGTNTQIPVADANGCYYFYGPEKVGAIIVNDNMKTIQVGTTLYDLHRTVDKHLVYHDNEQGGEAYFDIRAVYGVDAHDFKRNADGSITTTDKMIGSGSYSIWTYDKNATLLQQKDVNCIGAEEQHTSKPITTQVIMATSHDGQTDENGVNYWSDSSQPYTRLKMSSFVPIANWAIVISSVNKQNGATAKLFIWYPRVVFENGFVEIGETGITTLSDSWNKSGNKIADLSEADITQSTNSQISGGSTFSTQFEAIYGMSVADALKGKWYDKMNVQSLASLWTDTVGKFFFDKDYVCRAVDISHSSVAEPVRSGVNTTKPVLDGKGENAGIMYWLEDVGYIYNMPLLSDFRYKKYFDGDYLLPLAIRTDGGTPLVINYNINYYGTAIDTSDGRTVMPYGTMFRDDVTIRADNTIQDALVYADGRPYTSPSIASYKSGKNRLIYDTDQFVPAPSGIYSFLGLNPKENVTVGDLTRYAVDSTLIYYGASQLKLVGSSINDKQLEFTFINKNYPPVDISPGTLLKRVYRGQRDVFIVATDKMSASTGEGTLKINVNDYGITNPLNSWLGKIGILDLLNLIDTGASWLIIIVFKVIPIVAVILITILVGLSFLSDNKIAQQISGKIFDPVRLLTLGAKQFAEWRWQKVLLPCILVYLAFILLLNGNLLRILVWLSTGYGKLLTLIKS